MKKYSNKPVSIITVFLFLAIVIQCTPGQRLAALLHQHPELLKSDTTSKDSTYTPPSIIVNDSTKLGGVDTTGLHDFIKKCLAEYKAIPNDSTIKSIEKEATDWKKSTLCLSDTININHGNGYSIKIWESKNGLFHTSACIPQPIEHFHKETIREPYQVTTNIIPEWRIILEGISAGFNLLLIILLVVILKFKI